MNTKEFYTFIHALVDIILIEYEIQERLTELKKDHPVQEAGIQDVEKIQEQILQKTDEVRRLYGTYFTV